MEDQDQEVVTFVLLRVVVLQLVAVVVVASYLEEEVPSLLEVASCSHHMDDWDLPPCRVALAVVVCWEA